MFTYAVLRLVPRALLSQASSWSYLRKGNTASQTAATSVLASSGSISEQFYGSRDASSHGGEHSPHVVRPLQHNKWYKGTDGFLVTDIWGLEVGSMVSATPTVWLQQTEERMYLSVYQHKSLTLILLFPISSILIGEQGISVIKQQVVENVSLLFVLVTILFSVFLLLKSYTSVL